MTALWLWLLIASVAGVDAWLLGRSRPKRRRDL
jgi:hypothetical protein